MKPFEERDRYNYDDISPEDVVVDAGCYEGNFTNLIHSKYGCRVLALEPVPEFFERCYKRFAATPNVRVRNDALGDSRETTYLKVKGDQSGQWADSVSRAECGTVTPLFLLDWAGDLGCAEIALLKLNIEGDEYRVLEFILREGLARQFTNLQVQFHACVPGYAERHDAIRAALARTHELVYDEPFIWTGWKLKA